MGLKSLLKSFMPAVRRAETYLQRDPEPPVYTVALDHGLANGWTLEKIRYQDDNSAATAVFRHPDGKGVCIAGVNLQESNPCGFTTILDRHVPALKDLDAPHISQIEIRMGVLVGADKQNRYSAEKAHKLATPGAVT